MIIESLELFKIPPRWLFLKMTTKSGLIGWGEPIAEGRADTVAMAVRELSEYIIGKSAGNIEDLFNVLHRGGFYRGGPILTSAISGIEQAMWDIKGKYYNTPVYELLGGACREKMQVYSWIGGDKVENIVEAAKEKYEEGYRAVKMMAVPAVGWIESYKQIERTVGQVAAIRKELGYEMDIGIDFHGRLHKNMVFTMMKALEPYKLMFVEEPVLCENEEIFPQLRGQFSIPIATGERNYTRWGFKNIIINGGVDIIQPDPCHCGGILETKKIAAMAEAFDIALAPHCPLGPIALAVCLQIDFCTYNAVIQEQSLGYHFNDDSDVLDLIDNKTIFQYKDGFVSKPNGPGLGININEEKVILAAKKGHNWRNPVWRNVDGTFVEW